MAGVAMEPEVPTVKSIQRQRNPHSGPKARTMKV
jgi:hypothetical protein